MEGERPHLVLLDFMLSGTDGIGLMKEMLGDSVSAVQRLHDRMAGLI